MRSYTNLRRAPGPPGSVERAHTSTTAPHRTPAYLACLVLALLVVQAEAGGADLLATGIGQVSVGAERTQSLQELFQDTLESVQQSLGRHLQATSSNACPANYRPAFRGSTGEPPATGAVTYASLRATYGWDTPATRPRSTNTTNSTRAADFNSVMCISFGNNNADRTSCTKDPVAGAAAVHVRYDCSTRQFWVLLYVFSDMFFDTDPGNMWAVNECGATCGGGDNKFLNYLGTATSGSCSITCPAACTAGQTSCWCCQDMWPIVDGTAGWVGYMAKVSFTLAAGTTVSSDTFMVHSDFGLTATATGDTGSTPDGRTATNGICFDCTPPPVIDVAVNISAAPTSMLLGSTFTYSVNMSNVLGTTSTGNNGFVIRLPAGVTPTDNLTSAAGTPTASCVTTGSTATGWTLNCSVISSLNATAVWSFSLPANVTTLSSKVANVTLLQSDSNLANNYDDAVVSPFVTCGAPSGLGVARPACPAATSYAGPDNLTIASSTAFNSSCCVFIDVAVNITATPSSQVVGSAFAYTVNITNVGTASSPGSNGFVIQVPPGVTVPPNTVLVPGTGTPAATCVQSVQDGWTVLTCTVDSALNVTQSWEYTFKATGSTIGDYTAFVSLTKPDSNPANNADDAPINVFGTMDVAVNITATPSSQVVGSSFAYAVNITNVGTASSPGSNGFVIQVPPGVTVPPNTVLVPGTGTPAATCVQSVQDGWTVLTCTVDSALNVTQSWEYTFNATGSTIGDYTAFVSLTKPDSNPANNADDAPINVFGTVDVAVNITATPSSQVVGSSFAYAVNITNVGTASSPGSNGFVIQVPPGVTVPPNTVLVPGTGTPAATCVQSVQDGWTVLTCTVDSALNVTQSWEYTFNATGSTIGDYTAFVSLTNPDSNPANNADDAPINVFGTVDVAVNITATPSSQVVGSSFAYAVNITNVGTASSPGSNGFVIQVPPGVTVPPNTVLVPGTGTPAATCVQSVQTGWTVLNCSVNSALNVTQSWEYTFNATGSTIGDYTAFVSLTKPDSNPANNADDAPINVFGTVDVAVNITATPSSQVVGSSFAYAVNITNVGTASSPGSNGFVIQVPPGVTVPPNTVLVPGTGTPAATCVQSVQDGWTVLTCTVDSALNVTQSWEYTFNATGSTIGDYTAFVSLTNPDSNPANNADDAPINVFATCGNPGTSLQCDVGASFVGPPEKQLADVNFYQTECCVSGGSLPFDVSITTGPCAGAQVNQTASVSFTVASVAGTAPNVGVVFVYTAKMNLIDVAAVDPTGAVDYMALGSCGPPPAQGEDPFVACSFFDLVQDSQVVITLTFRPTTTANFTVMGEILPDSEGLETSADNNVAFGCLNVLNCPIYQAPLNGVCQPVVCNPCADANPTVYISTGSGSKPANGLWQVRNFSVGNMALTPEFLCVIAGVSQQIGDIAVLHRGDIVVLDTSGVLHYIPVEQLPAPSTDYTRRCNAIPLFTFSGPYTGYLGLSVGFRSDMVIASTGNGWVIPLRITGNGAGGSISAAPLPGGSAEQPLRFGCSDNTTIVTNTGGTDITPGPDGAYYRWCAKDAGMNYTGTRFTTTFKDGYPQLNSPGGEFVSNRLSDQVGNNAFYANAGSFCTSTHVVGTGAYVRPSTNSVPNLDSGAYAQFYALGVIDGQPTAAWPLKTVRGAQAAQLIGRTATIVNATGSPITDSIRVNGAAVKPRCLV